jgi:methyl-accepting chemotaxis protein
MSFANLKIGARLGLAFGAVFVLVAVILAMGLNSMGRIESRMGEIINKNNVKVATANQLSAMNRDIIATISNVVLLPDDAQSQAGKKKFEDDAVKYAKVQEALTKLLSSEQEKALMAKLNDSLAVAIPGSVHLIGLREQHKSAEAMDYLMTTFMVNCKATLTALDNIIAHEQAMSVEAGQDALAEYVRARNLTLIIGALSLVLVVAVAWSITRSITGPINNAVNIAETVAAGDLTVRIDAVSTDETGRLLHALKNMNQNLIRMVGEIRVGTDAIAKASDEIAAGNSDLSSRTEAQASSLEETASAMDELTGTVKLNSDNAAQANALATSASGVALQGGEVVADVINTMEGIKDSSKKIVEIISVIDGIAFQTNILALNAAVEAARAGEQGRGFAVVATEVRNLAQRSAAAAKEIKTLINDSVGKIDSGAALVDQAGNTMGQIVQSVKQVADIIGEISAASSEQTAGIEQINHAIRQMDEGTRQNSLVVEQAAAASGAMQQQAAHLAQVVSVFQLAPGASRAAAPASGPSLASSRQAAVLPPARNNTGNALAIAPARRAVASSSPGAGEWEAF